MAKKKQAALGGPLMGTPMDAAADWPAAEGAAPTAEPDLDAIQADSEKQALPDQEKLFRVAPRVRSKLHNLPDPTKPPLGFVPGRGFDVVFPFVKLPHLAPDLNGDWVRFGSPELEPNRLYYGDNLQVLRTLPSKSIDLIYIDPPFFSGAEYNVIWGDTNEVRTFSDIWEDGLDTYLIWLNARLWEMRRVLKETGSIYVHCDFHASHYIKAEMDKVFGYTQARSEIVWRRSNSHNKLTKQFGPIHDVIFFYSKSDEFSRKFHPSIRPHSRGYLATSFKTNADGETTQLNNLTGPGRREGASGVAWRGYDPTKKGRHWAIPRQVREALGDRCIGLTLHATLELAYELGIVVFPNKEGGQPRYRQLPTQGVPLQDIWAHQPHTSGHLDGTEDGIDEDVKWLDEEEERIGYPTQKPEGLLKRIIASSSDAGDVVADFFCGGGVTPVVAQGLARRWIACDSSRVAVSVTLNRLVQAAEETSGVRSNYGTADQAQGRMDLPTPENAVPDMRVNYVGVYPMDRFKAVEQNRFEQFVLQCLAAQADNSDLAISGWRSAREPLRVGPADPDAAPDAKDVQAFFDDVLKRLETNVRTVARYVCWRTSPGLVAYRKKLSDYVRRNVQPRGADLDFDFLLIDSEDFRERIRAKYPDADDNEFLLRFTKEPVIGEIATTRTGALKNRFEARDADSTNTGGYLVNCQWDFDYQRGHFAADRDYVLGRTELKGKDAKAAGRKYEAVLTAEHTFERAGERTIACRVQDNLGAEAIHTITIEVN